MNKYRVAFSGTFTSEDDLKTFVANLEHFFRVDMVRSLEYQLVDLDIFEVEEVDYKDVDLTKI